MAITRTSDDIPRDIYKVQPNNPSQAGKLASEKRLFGAWNRYAIAAVHTRFDDVQWFVWDAEVIDEETGLPAVVSQADRHDEAIAQMS